MAKFLTPIDLNKNELQNARVQNLSSAPATPVAGQIYFNTTDSIFYYYTGTAWTAASGDITAVSAGTGLTGGGTAGAVTLSLQHLGLENLTDPNADRIIMWDDSATKTDWLTISTGLTLSGTTLTNSDRGSQQSIFKTFSDGTNTATADSNTDTFKFRGSNGVTIVVANDDPTHGDNALISLASVPNSALANSSVTYTAGNGLTGGGSVALGGTANLAVGAGTGIVVNADDVALKNTGALTSHNILKWDGVGGQLANSLISETQTAVTIGGDLIVTGTTTSVNSNEVNIGDSIILLNSDEVGEPSQNGGIEIERGTQPNVQFVWDETNDYWSTIDQPLHIGLISAGGTPADILMSAGGLVQAVTPAAIVNTGLTLTDGGNTTITDTGVGSWSVAVATSSTTTKGVVELATNTETTTGTSTTLATTPAGVNAAINAKLDAFTKSFAATIGDGAATQIDANHGLGTTDVIVQLFEVSTGDTIFADVTRSSEDIVQLRFSVAPASNSIRVLIQALI